MSLVEDNAWVGYQGRGRVHDPDTDLLVRSDPLETDCRIPVDIFHRNPVDNDLFPGPLDNDPLVQDICQLMDNHLERFYW